MNITGEKKQQGALPEGGYVMIGAGGHECQQTDAQNNDWNIFID